MFSAYELSNEVRGQSVGCFRVDFHHGSRLRGDFRVSFPSLRGRG